MGKMFKTIILCYLVSFNLSLNGSRKHRNAHHNIDMDLTRNVTPSVSTMCELRITKNIRYGKRADDEQSMEPKELNFKTHPVTAFNN